MFEPTSRYSKSSIMSLFVTTSDRQVREIRYIQRRFIPSAEGAMTLVEHTVSQGERLDTITARYLGDPTLFWRVCDGNIVLSPGELTEVGQVITIAVPQL